eukprot:4295023-Pyramimonas_sp.AAC.1
MWLSPQRRAHLSYTVAGVSRFPMFNVLETVFWNVLGCQGAPVTLIRGVEFSGVAFWRNSGPPRRNSQADSRR